MTVALVVLGSILDLLYDFGVLCVTSSSLSFLAVHMERPMAISLLYEVANRHMGSGYSCSFLSFVGKKCFKVMDLLSMSFIIIINFAFLHLAFKVPIFQFCTLIHTQP